MRTLLRAVGAEAIRAGGVRGSVMRVALPGAVVLPLVVTSAVAVVSEKFSGLSGEIRVTSVSTSNAVYWVITFTVIVWTVIAAAAQAASSRGARSDQERYLFPWSATGPLARWLTYGGAAALTAAILVVVVLFMLPRVFPEVYGGVELFSAAGARFVLVVPCQAFLAAGLGVGVGAVITQPSGAAALILAWAYLIENAVALIPSGYTVQGYMPFLNGMYATGQDLALTPPWGRDGALAYFALIAVSVFLLGVAALGWRRRR